MNAPLWNAQELPELAQRREDERVAARVGVRILSSRRRKRYVVSNDHRLMSEYRDVLQASLGDAYAIERELGGAGMSRVFLAEDTSLHRRVVVKVLASELTGAVSIARFRREISLAARLQHPHIVPLLAAGEMDGVPYYIMPFVEGDSLRARLAHGEMPVSETISILRDVAKALAFAHAQGVTHRDIKPDNVLLAGTSAVITDFGVSKAVSDAALGGPLTSVGVALGTPAYMAPEQAAADPETDLRADIYAFGAMAFEMLAGHQPFSGRNVQAVLAAHATEAPPSIARLRPAAPASLAALVMRCLEKRPGDRPQSATELVQALDATATTVSSAPGSLSSVAAPSARRGRLIVLGVAAVVAVMLGAAAWRARSSVSADGQLHTIAVLPFENTSHDTTFDYLEEGITDHVRDALNAIPTLTVKARSSSRQLKGHETREIGSKLGVDAVLRGTVSRSAARLHVTAELVRTADDIALWSSTFDGQPSELGGMQDTIVRAVVGKLHVVNIESGVTAKRVGRGRGTADIDAYDRFLKAHYAYDKLDFLTAISLLKDALARDPRFALAEGYLAMAYANAPTAGVASLDSMNALARVAIARTHSLDSTVAEAYVAESFIMSSELRLVDALVPIRKAAALDSNSADILSSYALALSQVGRVDEALAPARRARHADPLSAIALGIYSEVLGQARQYDESLRQLRAALDIDPTNPLLNVGQGYDLAFSGRPDSALEAFETGFKLNPRLFLGRANLVFAYAQAGRWADARAQRALFDKEDGGNSPNLRRTVVHIAFGENDAAMTTLERSVAAREALLGVMSLPCDQVFDPLKSDPRFAALMRHLEAHTCPATGKWPIALPPPR